MVSVTCSKPTNPGWSSSLGFSLVARYGPEGCEDDNSAAASTSVTPVPDVGVEIDEAGISALCDAGDEDFTFNAHVYNYGTSLAKLNVSASWINGNCRVDPNTEGEAAACNTALLVCATDLWHVELSCQQDPTTASLLLDATARYSRCMHEAPCFAVLLCSRQRRRGPCRLRQANSRLCRRHIHPHGVGTGWG